MSEVNSKYLIINADDFGLTDGICRSILDLFENNAISNTSVMICVEGAEKHCREFLNSGFSKNIGVHLQITPEQLHKKPLSPVTEIPTLVDSSGNFKPKGHTDWINPVEVELEWERQILKTCEVLKDKPSHLDSHHGVHRINELTPIYLKLARKYGLPVRGGNSAKSIDTKALNIKSTSMCSSAWTGQDKGKEDFIKILMEDYSLIKDGVVEVCSHPGYFDNELLISSSWNKVRENDHKVLLEIAKEGVLKANNINLMSFSDL